MGPERGNLVQVFMVLSETPRLASVYRQCSSVFIQTVLEPSFSTVVGRGWWVWFRFYGPTEAFFDKSWQLPDFERVD